MSRPPGELVLFRIAPLLLNGIVLGRHLKAIHALDRAIVKAVSPRRRVERSESLDEREASARIDDVMAVRNFAVS
jgi:hypothetical protein